MKTIHIVNNLDKINFGIWNAALFGCEFLKKHYEIDYCLIVCNKREVQSPLINVPILRTGRMTSIIRIISSLEKLGFASSESIVVSHGCWQTQSHIAYKLKMHGYNWVYSPHGMLEPWSLANYRLKKWIYFHLLEKRYCRAANAVRAVSKIEQFNLERLLKRKIDVVENGAPMPEQQYKRGPEMQFLFMARLHFKKGILPLVKAWTRAMNGSNAKLIIAGPDEGELTRIKPYLSGNIKYVGSVYGETKKKLLQQCHYYLLPSHSEGFPTSVVEAMSFGLIPVISAGCNFPEVFNNRLGYQVEPDETSIATQLSLLRNKSFDYELSQLNRDFVEKNYSEPVLAKKLYLLYRSLMNR